MNSDPIVALSVAVTGMKLSKSKDCKTILKALNDDYPDVMATVENVVGAAKAAVDSDMAPDVFLACCIAMGVGKAEIKAGAEPCIVEGRYAVRTVDGLKLGPKVA